MLEKLIKTVHNDSGDLIYEIGSNSDLVLENTITRNLEWTIERFGKEEKGFITMPTKFDTVEPLLGIDHKGRTIFRMSVNPQEVIRRVEFGTSPLKNRINALNNMKEAGYKVGILIAPVVLIENWKTQYRQLFDTLSDSLSDRVKSEAFFEVIFMTYSYVHRMINNEAFPNAVELYDKELMTVRGRGKYSYNKSSREEGEEFLRSMLHKYFPDNKVVYVV